ncbi:Hpt domain-containing protein [Rhodanobacter ginsenosidimutans]|uniref:histidine kinase n=1 Tax=Rhodanobacter ginsenosidimutans TaxID=490571 RepID=A0ABW0JWX6_9GAMM
MRLQDHIDFTTLQWVKPQLDEALSSARDALATHVENPADRSVMRSCVDQLHQVRGTLQMVELHGAAMAAAEMEEVSRALLDDQVANREDAYAVLMRGLMQLPDYLERLSGGHRDVPVVLLPLLNDLRAAIGKPPLSESALFHPNLDAFLPEQAPAAMSESHAEARRGELTALRLRFQRQLLGWFRGEDPTRQLAGMRTTLLEIAARCYHVHGRRLWWIAAGVLEGLGQGLFKNRTTEIRQLIGKVDRNIRELVEHGEDSLRGGDADELACQLLYLVAQSPQRSPQMELLQSTYALDRQVPDASELEHARGSMAGHNRALLDSVSRALKDDLLRVKEALDLFLRQVDGDPAQLAAQGEVLERVGDTLGMLALAVPRRMVVEQRQVLDEIANHMRSADEAALLDVAGALLYVEASLDDHIESLGAEGVTEGDEGVVGVPRSEAMGIVVALMQEAISNTGKVKDAIVAFSESGWQHEHLAGSPALMDEVAGALRMLSTARPAELAEGISRFIGNELLLDRRVPDGAQMDHLADALAALEYYLEAAREHRGGLEHILDVAEHSLGLLGYWPPPAARELPETPPPVAADALPTNDEHVELSESVSVHPGDSIDELIIGEDTSSPRSAQDIDGLRLAETESLKPESAESASDEDWVEIEEEIVEQVPVTDPLAATAGFNANAEGIDDDIREIFLEEMQEEIDNLTEAEKVWLDDPAQLSSLTAIRRSFHTLKGSGRLVGASVLGEFAWKVESTLNRVLDNSIEPHEGVQAMVHRAIDALPQLLAALKGEGALKAPLGAIMDVAERLAAGEEGARVEGHPSVVTETVRRVVRRRVPRMDADAAAIPQAGITDAHTLAGAPDDDVEPVEALPLPVMPPVDPVLLEILRSEVAQYLQTIRGAIQRAGTELRVGEELLRAVHTLHGAIAMVDIALLMQVLSPLEGLLKRLRAADVPLSSEGIRLLGEAADVVDTVMEQFDAADPQLPVVDALVDEIVAMRDLYSESQVAHVVYESRPDDLEDAAALGAEHDLDAWTPSYELDAMPVDNDEAPAIADETPADETLSEASPAAAFVDGAEPAADADDAHHETFASELMAALDAFEPGETRDSDIEDAPVDDAVRMDDENAAIDAQQDDLDDAGLAEELAAELEAVEREAAAREAAEREAAEQREAEARASAEREAAEREAAGRRAREARELAEREASEAAALARQTTHAVDAGAVSTTVEGGADETPAANALDDDLLEVFLDEAHEILDHADDVLAQWRAEPTELGYVGELQRDLHTLKGGARISGLGSIGDLAHAIETLLEKPVDASGTASLIGALESSFDQLNAMVQQVAHRQTIEYPQAAIDRLLALAGEEGFTNDDVLAAIAMPEAAAPASPVAASGERTPDGDLPGLLPEVEEEVRSTQEQIRVRADLLDSLVNHAGEVAIYRSRLEQQVAGYRFNLVELEQTVARLRSQLRMLEIETEAQIIARFQREHREAGLTTVFDPLELDRYSQLQQYSRALAESVSDLVSIQSTLDELTRQAETLLIQQSRVSTDLQDGLLRTRMLPFDTMVPNLRRTLRQAAQEEGKHAQLYVDGAHGEMDRNLLDRIKAPFEHMLRNAIAHGIETPDERRKVGKPAEGAVHIRVAREATEVVVRVSDDGRGLDREAIRARGIERGLLRADANPSDDQLLGLITQAGFSTAGKITQLAGRGVGMDVVANEIKQLGGSLSIESTAGKGTTFVLRLPFTLAVTQAILVRIGEATFAIPMTSVQGVARIDADEMTALLEQGEPTFSHGNESYAIHDLAELLGLPPGLPPEGEQQPLLLTRAGDLRAAIRIDAVLGSHEIVVKSVGPQISSVPGLLGATIMGDGSVLIILDLAPLVRHGITRREQRLAEGLSALQAPVIEEVRVRPLVMVVDDSITMRKVTSRVLERHEYEVSTAKDGVDAVEKLHERVPDLMLLDIEMPRMDGYELATLMKADPRLSGVPIIMITSRSGDKHRQRALDIGVERYLGKPYQEADLLTQIGEVLELHASEPAHD